jgi:lysophospholipase L1-like esterase
MSMRRSPILRIVLLALTLPAAACDKLFGDNPVAPSAPPAAGSTIIYSAIGASDAIGWGSSVPCILYEDCPNGMGYVAVAARQLRAQNFTVKLQNLGIPTAVIGRDFESLGRQYNREILGNFVEQEMPFILTDSTVVTVFAGVNEVITVVAALGAGAGGNNQSAYIDGEVKAFGDDYAALVAGIRTRAPKTRVIALNVPNVAAIPYFSTAPLSERQVQQRLSVGFAGVVNALANQGAIIIDAMCDPRAYLPANYSSDFHPNDSGYAFMAAEVVRAITSATYPAPKASCAQMTVVS